MKINILGTEYTITEATESEDANLKDCDGYCDNSTKTIVIDKLDVSGPGIKGDLSQYKKQLYRHEITHAFLCESGLAECSWAPNEEMVDWLAIQAPKLVDAFKSVNALV